MNAKSEDEVKNLINEFLDKVPQEKKDLKNRKSNKHQDSDEEKVWKILKKFSKNSISFFKII